MLKVITSPTATWRGAAGSFAGVKVNVAAETPIVAAPTPSRATAAAMATRCAPGSLPLPTMDGSIAEATGIYKPVDASLSTRAGAPYPLSL